MRRRIQRINDLLRQEISDLLRQVRDPRLGAMVSVTEVQTSSDLSHARVFVSIWGSADEKKAVLVGLRSATRFLRYELAHRLELRQVPELAFYQDDSIERGTRILSLLHEVTPAAPSEEKEEA